MPGGSEAANLEVAKSYVTQFGNLAKENNTMIVPGNLTDVTSMVAAAMSTIKQVKTAAKPVRQAAAPQA